jgi:hypothetical protein
MGRNLFFRGNTMKKLLFTGLMIVNMAAVCTQSSTPLRYWGKNLSELKAQDPVLKQALSDAYWDSLYVRFFSLFTSQFSQERVGRMQNSLAVIDDTIERINKILYKKSESYNNATAEVLSFLGSMLFSSRSKEEKIMIHTETQLYQMRNTLIYALSRARIY